jgi:hypothetical protein
MLAPSQPSPAPVQPMTAQTPAPAIAPPATAPATPLEQRIDAAGVEQAEHRAFENAFAAAADGGESFEVNWGEELFCPVQYNSFRVGPFKVVGRTRPGESIAQAIARVHAEMDRVVRSHIFPQKADAYMRDLDSLSKLVQRYRP